MFKPDQLEWELRNTGHDLNVIAVAQLEKPVEAQRNQKLEFVETQRKNIETALELLAQDQLSLVAEYIFEIRNAVRQIVEIIEIEKVKETSKSGEYRLTLPK